MTTRTFVETVLSHEREVFAHELARRHFAAYLTGLMDRGQALDS